MDQFVTQLWDVLRNLFDKDALIGVLSRPEAVAAAFTALALVIFTETGLLLGFFLPGDSLLVVAGVAAAAANWPVLGLVVVLSIAAVVGDTVGYWIGYRSGPALFNREKSWLFHPEHLRRAQAFYEKHGGKTIVLARFMPIIRTFAPVVAGIGRMDYRRFLFYNVFGGIGWVASMVLVGYLLVTVLDRVAEPYFGPKFTVRWLEVIIVLVVLLSVSPALWAAARSWLARRRRAATPETPTADPRAV
jgi:membrane-associated protein